MADIKILKVNSDGLYQEHDEANDSLKVKELKTETVSVDRGVEGKNASLSDTNLSLNDGTDSFNIGADNAYMSDLAGKTTDIFAGKIQLYDGSNNPLLPTQPQDVVVKKYVDDAVTAGVGSVDLSDYLKKDGSVAMTADFDAGSQKIKNLADPVLGTDAVNLQTLQAYQEGLKPKGAVIASTTADVLLADLIVGYELDGVTLEAGQRILVKDQDLAEENGIYVVQASGAPVRAVDFDSITPIDEINGAYVPVQQGTLNGGKFFVQAFGTVASVGVDPIYFTFFNSVATLRSGDGIDINGNIISALLDSVGGLKFDGGAIAIDFSTSFDDAKAVKAMDLASETAGYGASLIGVEAGKFTYNNGDPATNVDETLEALGEAITLVEETPPNQILYVSKSGNDGWEGSAYRPFLTIKAAQDSITDASASKRYVIMVGPGFFTELAGFEFKSNITYVGIGSRASTTVAVASGSIAMNASDVAGERFYLMNLAVNSAIVMNTNNTGTNVPVFGSYHLFLTAPITVNNTSSVLTAQPQLQLYYSRLGAITTSGSVQGFIQYSSHGTITFGSATPVTDQGYLELVGCTSVSAVVTCNASSFTMVNSHVGNVIMNEQGLGHQEITFGANCINGSITKNGDIGEFRFTDVKYTKYAPATSGNWVGTITEPAQALDELASRLKTAEFKIEEEAGHVKYLAGTAGVTKGDLVYLSSAGTVDKFSTITNNDEVLGIALETKASGQVVQVSALDEILEGVLTGATVNTRYYWDGSALSTSMSTASGANVWLAGIAVSATDLAIKVRQIKKNA